MSDPNDHFRIKHYFDELMDLPKAKQIERIQGIELEQPQIAAQLRLLLELDDGELDSLVDGARRSVFKIMHDNEATLWVGRRIDRYQVLAEIGRGGMGIVFKARREDGDLQQDVAIKLLRPGVLDQQVLTRFLRERKFLASLRHPNICGFIDSGMTDDGTPYVVMEYLEGTDLLEYASSEKLDIVARLKLFCKVLQGVGHAHRSLIIHRDIKPTNIFVDSFANPKLLDFGIARSIDGPNKTAETQQWFTADYGAPEQILGRQLTTACDIYSLGAVLFELLAGKPMVKLQGKSPTEIEQIVVHTAAPRLELTSKPHFWQRMVGKTVDVELNGIVQKALRKEPEARYASADEFAQDIENWLAGLPVKASGSDRWYRLKKFVRRNIVTVAAIAAVLLASLTSVVVVSLQNQRVLAERDRAELSLSVLTDAFTAADPLQTGRGDISVREVLRSSSDSLMKLRESQPEDFLQLATTFAEVQLRVGLPKEAVEVTDQAYALVVGRSNENTENKILQLRVRAQLALGDRPGAARILEQTDASSRQWGAIYLLLRADAYNHSTELDQKIAMFEAGLNESPMDPNDPIWVASHWKLAVAYRFAKRPHEATRVLDSIEHALNNALASNHPQLIRTRLEQLENRHALGMREFLLDDALILRQDVSKIFGDRSIPLADTEAVIAKFYRAEQKYQLASEHTRVHVEINEAQRGRLHENTLRGRVNLAKELMAAEPKAMEVSMQFAMVAEDALASPTVDSDLRDFLVMTAAEYFVWRQGGDPQAMKLLMDQRFQPNVATMDEENRTRFAALLEKLIKRNRCSKSEELAVCRENAETNASCQKLNSLKCSLARNEG